MNDGGTIPLLTRSASRGVIAAMAMSGMRTVTRGLGLLEQTPPDALADEHARELLHRVKLDRDVVVELAHWGYGAMAAVAFSRLPATLRRQTWVGPAYGLAIWLGFEAGVAPLLGVKHVKQKRLTSRLSLAADHVLYGAVVAQSPWPHDA